MTTAQPGRHLDAAVARIGDVAVAVSGPAGAGKTGVLLALLARGASAVAFERVRVTSEGVVREDGAIRVRAHHLHLLGESVHLSRSERARLRCGALAMRLPRIGPRIGRRCFVDLAPSAVRAWASTDRVDLLVRLEPRSADLRPTATPPCLADDGSAASGGFAPAVALGTRGRSVEEVAVAIGEVTRSLRWSPSR